MAGFIYASADNNWDVLSTLVTKCQSWSDSWGRCSIDLAVDSDHTGTITVGTVNVNTPLPKSDFRGLLVAQLYFTQTGWGVAQVFTDNAGLELLIGLLMASVAAGWVVMDARQRGKPILHVVQFFLVFTWGVSVPVYLVWTRGLRGIGWLLLHTIGLFAALNSGFVITSLFVNGLM